MSDVYVQLDQLVEFSNGRSRPSDQGEPKYPIFGANGVIGQASRANSGANVSIVGRVGAYCGAVHYSKQPCWITDNSIAANAREGVNSRFIYYLLRSLKLNDHQIGSGQPLLTQNILKSLKVREIPRREQEIIAQTLGTLDDKIDINNHIIASALALAEATYESTLKKNSGQPAKLESIVSLKYGKALPKAKRIEGDYPVYGSGGISGFHNTPLVDGPGIVVGRKGTIGSVYWSTVPFFPIDTVFYVESVSQVPLEFIYFTLKSLNLEGMNSDSAVPGLNRSRVLDLDIHLPAPEVIESFQNACCVLFKQVDATRAENTSLVELRDTLLPKLMSGQIRIRDAEKVVEDAV